MREMSPDVVCTNLTELWWDAGKQALLTVCGYAGERSDYGLLREFCACLERLPDAPQAAHSRAQLRALFGDRVPPPAPAHCRELWQLTARALAAHPCTRRQASRLWEAAAVCPPPAPGPGAAALPRGLLAVPAPSVALRLNDVCPPPNGRSWPEWANLAGDLLARTPVPSQTVLLELPAGFRPRRPDLYRVGRLLTGEAPDGNLWLSQLFLFLCRRAAALPSRPVLRTACPTDMVCGLLTMTARVAPLPDLVWMPVSPPAFPELCRLAECILPSRLPARPGIPPVLVYLPKGKTLEGPAS